MRNIFSRTIRSRKLRNTIAAVLLALSTGVGPLLMPMSAFAASSVVVTTTGLVNGNFPGAPVPASSPAIAVLRVSVTASQASQTLNSVTVNFSGTGFGQTDLASIATGATSGVALYGDNGGTAGSFDGTDSVVTLAASPNWTGVTTNITLTPAVPVALTSGVAKIFFVVIKTSDTISNDDRIIAAVAASGVVTSDGNGPSSTFTALELRADTAPAQISQVPGFVGSASVNVKFNKPVQKVGGGALTSAEFTYVDGGGSAQTISSVAHTPGQDFATLTMSGSLDAQDLDGTPATLAAGSNAIADMGGNVLATTAVGFSSPVTITTATIPTAIVGTVYTTGTPLVAFAANGGTAPYTFSPDQAGDGTTLTTVGLSVVNDGGTYKLTGTVANVPGSYQVRIKVLDSGVGGPVSRPYTLNVATSGGGVPGVTNVAPGGGPVSASGLAVNVTGTNTHFTGSSTVQFLSSGTNDSNIVATVTASTATTLTLSVNIGGATTPGSRDVRVTTGSEVANMPGGFGVFASGSSGLGLLLPSDAATSVPIPPGFNFNPSSNGSLASYRITVKSTADFSGTALWDYTFPKPADIGNTNNSHCSVSGCNVGYGEGRFRIMNQPTPLAPNTTYYWQVRTYSQAIDAVADAATPLESTVVRSFTTTASVTDTTPPNIQHRPVFQATASTNLNLFARVVDNLATFTTTPALSSAIIYCAGTGCTPSTSATGTVVGSGYFKYVIPSGTVGVAGTIIRYFLTASDGTNTFEFKAGGGVPFQMTSAVAGVKTITGTVRDNAGACPAGVQGATVFADGTGFNTTTDGSCAYTLSGLTSGTYDLIALKEGYADRTISSVPADSVSIAFTLNQGSAGGFGGDSTKPRVMFTGPPDNMSNVPGGDSNFKIFVDFNKTMSQTSVTATGNLKVNEVNPSTGLLTDVTSKGVWTFYPTASNTPGIPPAPNLAVFALSQSGCSGAPCTLGDGKTFAVTVSSSVTDTSGNAVQGNQPDGTYAFTFSTGTTFTGTFGGGEVFGAGQFIPPHVTGANPAPGSFDVPVNRKLIISFSDAMADDTGAYILKNFVKLYTVSGTTETNVSASISTVSLDTGKKNATVTMTGSLTASTQYRLKVLGGAKAGSGLTVAPPGSEANTVFMSDFKTGTGSDTGAPTVTGSFPDSGATGVPVNLGAVSVGFSKDMDVSTITTSTVNLTVGSTAVGGTVEYHSNEHQAYFIPQGALTPNTTYTLNVTTDVKALNGTALATAIARTFTTNGADSTAPVLKFANADDYALAVTFSEPMNAAKAVDTINFPASVLKPASYTLKYATVGTDSSTGTTITLPATASFSYDQVTNTIQISGYHDGSITAATLLGKELYIAVANVKDLSGNAITTAGAANTAKVVIQNSSTTKGALGPMGVSGDAFSSQGTFVPKNFDSGTFGFAPPVEVRPSNTLPGQTTNYSVRIPLSKQIPAAGAVVLTFPVGFDISGAKQDVFSPKRQDLNGPGTGTVTFKCDPTTAPTGGACATTANADDTGANQGGLAGDGVVVDNASHSVTVYISSATNVEGHDFLSIDLAGIKNSTVPKDFTTSGYTVDVKTKNGATLLESLTSMPFFIQSGAAGSFTVGGTITATGNSASGTMKVYLFSPVTGPLETVSADFGGTATATYSFTSLPPGDYGLSTDQNVAIGVAQFVGKTMPERIQVTGNTTYNFTMGSATSGGTAVTVNVTGPANEPLDIFAGSPVGFRVMQVTLNGGGTGSVTLNLPNGQWNIGVGPQMPKGFSGPPPAPSYLPPKPKQAIIANPACVVDGTSSCTIAFALSTAGKTIKGVVKDGASKVIANAEVFAYSPTGGFGTHGTTDTAGNFILNVTDGSYAVGAFIPGMPSSKEVSVVVTSDAATYLLIDGATTAITPATALTSFVLKVAKPDYTISGKVTDGTSVAQGASVYAYRTDGPGHANVLTDSSGNYTLYVSTGAWKVGSFLPQYGQLSEQTVTITTASATNINFSPSQTGTGTFFTVSGTVTSGGTPVQGAFVRINGNSTANEAVTSADGSYSMKVPSCATASCYTMKAVVPSVGDTPPLAAFSLTADVANKDFVIGTSRTITVTFSASVTSAFIDLHATTGSGAHLEIKNATTGTLSLPDGAYNVRGDVPGMALAVTDVSGTGYDNTTGIFTVSALNTALTVTLPTLRTITGTVTDGTSNIANAWVEFVNPTTGVHFGTATTTATPGTNWSIKVADGTYFINAMKTGFFRAPSSVVVSGATAAQTLTLLPASTTISGQVLIGVTGASNAFVRAEKQGGGFSGTQADTNGNYVLPVSSGVWKIIAVAEGYTEATLSNPVDVTGGSVTGKDITLATAIGVSPPLSKPITPATGGTLDDTTSGLKLTLPGNALGTSKAAGSVQDKETTNVRSTDTATPVESFDAATNTYAAVGKEITATDSFGNPITNLDNAVTLEMNYTKAELAATRSATDTSINTSSEADKLTMAYWDTSNQSWDTLPSTVTYKDSSGNTVAAPASDLSNVASVTIAASTDHFSLYAPIVSTDPSAPTTPTGLAVTSSTRAQINLSWTAVGGATGYDLYRSTTSGGTYSLLGSEPTVGSGSTVTYNDTVGLLSSTTYYYKITAINLNGESAASSAVAGTTAASPSSSSSSGSTNTNTFSAITVTAPNGGQTLTADATIPITWSVTGSGVTAVRLSYSLDGGLSYAPITASAPNNGSYTWTIPKSTTTTARVQVEALSGATVLGVDISNANFSIIIVNTPVVTVPPVVVSPVVSPTTPATNQQTTPAVVTTPVITTPPAPSVTPVVVVLPIITKNLMIGSSGDAVSALQTFLVSKGMLKIPKGVKQGLYGPLTSVALKKFQKEAGLKETGTVDTATREKLSVLITEPVGKKAPAFANDLKRGSTVKEVKTLQEFLVKQGLLAIPKGQRMGAYGVLTEKAVRVYQKKAGLTETGTLNAQTRASLNAEIE